MSEDFFKQLELQLEELSKGMTGLDPDMVYLKELALNSKIFLLLLILGMVMLSLGILI